jgi:hypothetical protein
LESNFIVLLGICLVSPAYLFVVYQQWKLATTHPTCVITFMLAGLLLSAPLFLIEGLIANQILYGIIMALLSIFLAFGVWHKRDTVEINQEKYRKMRGFLIMFQIILFAPILLFEAFSANELRFGYGLIWFFVLILIFTFFRKPISNFLD